MNILVRINARLEWKCFRGQQNWIGVCDALKLTVQSETWGDLMEDINDTLDGVFKDLMASNELQEFLRHHGWQLGTPLPEKPQNVRFDIPFLASIVEQRGPHAGVHQ